MLAVPSGSVPSGIKRAESPHFSNYNVSMRHTRHTRLLFSLLALTGALFAQGTASLQFTQSFTAATTGAVVSNGPTVAGGPQGSVGFRMVYYIQPGSGTVSALSVELDGAATSTGSYTALTPAPGGGSGSSPTVNPAITSPEGQNNLCCDFYPFLHIKVNTLTIATGAPILIVKVMGYAGTSAAAGSGGGGGGGGGTGNAASIVTYVPAASVTLTCPSGTADTVTVFDPAGTPLAANMAVTWSTCTPGQVVILRTIQAASGGPFTVTGLPTGSPAMSTYPSAGTIYSLSAATATTMTFVNVAANAGASSLGAGANGISRTVLTGTGVTVNLLAAKDASNPTEYNTAGLNGCGSGVAGYSATSGNTFELYTVPGTVLTMVADGTITAGHILTGGASTAGRVADTGQTARTSIPLATCIVGVALASATVGNTVLVAYDGTGIYGAGAASSVAWNAITNPTGNQALTMGTTTTTWTWTSGTTAFSIANGSGTIFDVDATNGRVGIGTTSPATTLYVSGASSGFTQISADGTTASGTNYYVGGTLNAAIGYGPTGYGGVHNTGTYIFSNNDITFGLLAGNPYVTIKGTTGNVGIGTTSPGSLLTVNGATSSSTLLLTAAAPTVAAAQIGYGSTTAAASNCTFTVITATACLVINVAGTTRYIPFQ